MDDWVAFLVGEERDRGIHDAHIVDEKDHDIRLLRSRQWSMVDGPQQRDEDEELFHWGREYSDDLAASDSLVRVTAVSE